MNDPTSTTCPRTVPGRYGTHRWPCTLRADHPGECQPQDRADLATLPPRERALCAALLDHARHQLHHPERDDHA